jgi:hypothetical protein
VEVPVPETNELYTHYAARAQAEGFSKVADVPDIESDTEPAHDEVVNVSPAPGTLVSPELVGSTEVIANTNPEASRIIEGAKVLGEQNPETELTEEQRQTTYARCVQMTEAAGVAGSECEKLPMFMSGSDVPTATEHDLKALAIHPPWVKLNYEKRSEVEEESPEKWYKGKGGCASTKPEGDSCDEYPFFATVQGGESASPEASLEWINAKDNSVQGGKYGNFVTACGLSTGNAFVAIPLAPVLKVPTTRLCNK